eukprot:Skav233204  [mRNA]  locus=scaffold24:502309:507628:- [translate_table: standard]
MAEQRIRITSDQKAKSLVEVAKVNSEGGANSLNGHKAAKPTPPEAVKVTNESRINSSDQTAKAAPPSEGVKAKGATNCLEAKAASQGVKAPKADLGEKSEVNEAPKTDVTEADEQKSKEAIWDLLCGRFRE